MGDALLGPTFAAALIALNTAPRAVALVGLGLVGVAYLVAMAAHAAAVVDD